MLNENWSLPAKITDTIQIVRTNFPVMCYVITVLSIDSFTNTCG